MLIKQKLLYLQMIYKTDCSNTFKQTQILITMKDFCLAVAFDNEEYYQS